MNRTELISRIADETGLSKAEATRTMDVMTRAITRELEAGGEVRLIDFGAFTVADRPARDGRNPKTGEAIRIAASLGVKFTAAKALKQAVNKPVRLTGARRRA